MNKKFRKIISLVLTCFIVTGMFLSGGACRQVQAAYYGWKLVKGPVTHKGIEEYYETKHQLSKKVDSANGVVKHLRTTSYSTQADGLVQGKFVTSYTIPPSVIKGEQKITLKIKSSVDCNMKNYLHGNYCNFYINNGYPKFTRKSDNSNSGNNLSITTGPNRKLKGTESVYCVIPAGKKNGETMTIVAETSIGQASMGELVGGMTTTWTYKWTNLSPKKGVVSKIANVKGAKAKITVQAVSGAKKYQIRYKVGKAKNWTTVKAKTARTFTINVNSGKKVTVQARVTNAYGTGSWGASKSKTTDKK